MPQPQSEARPSAIEAQTAPFLRLPTVMQWTGLGRSTIYRMIATNQFPAPVLLATRAVAWRRTDLEEWSQRRPVAAH